MANIKRGILETKVSAFMATAAPLFVTSFSLPRFHPQLSTSIGFRWQGFVFVLKEFKKENFPKVFKFWES
jgi:hypothetical protein